VSAQGFIKVPETAGRGFKIKTDLIEKLTVRKKILRAGVSSAAD
jgi:O-succinylbenzoate synthase